MIPALDEDILICYGGRGLFRWTPEGVDYYPYPERHIEPNLVCDELVLLRKAIERGRSHISVHSFWTTSLSPFDRKLEILFLDGMLSLSQRLRVARWHCMIFAEMPETSSKQTNIELNFASCCSLSYMKRRSNHSQSLVDHILSSAISLDG